MSEMHNTVDLINDYITIYYYIEKVKKITECENLAMDTIQNKSVF